MNRSADGRPLPAGGASFDWRTCVLAGAILCVLISILRYFDYGKCMNVQMYILFPLSLLTLFMLLCREKIYKCKDMWIAFAIITWTLISLTINREHVGSVLLSAANQHLCISLFICYPLAGLLEGERRIRAFRLIAALNVIFVTVICYYALYCVITGTSYGFPLSSTPFGVGSDGRLYLSTHPNGSGIYCQIAAILCVYLMLQTRSAVKLIAEGVALIGIFCALAVTDSRTAIIAFCFSIGLLGYLLVSRAPWKERGRFLRYPAAIICAVLAMALCLIGVKAAKKGVDAARIAVAVSQRQMAEAAVSAEKPAEQGTSAAAQTPADSSVPEPTQDANAPAETAAPAEITAPMQTAAPAETAAPAAAEPAVAVPALSDRMLDDSAGFNGRLDIWLAILKALPEKPEVLLFGTTPYWDVQEFEDDFPEKWPHNFHNSLLSTLVCYGVVGLILWMGFLACICFSGVKVFFAKPDKVDLPVAFLMSLLASECLVSLMESVILTKDLPLSPHTWIMLAGGLAVTTARELKKKNQG